MKVRCALCGRVFIGRIPTGGDGSALAPVWHQSLNLRWNQMVPCDGRFDIGTPVEGVEPQ